MRGRQQGMGTARKILLQTTKRAKLTSQSADELGALICCSNALEAVDSEHRRKMRRFGSKHKVEAVLQRGPAAVSQPFRLEPLAGGNYR